MEAFGTATSWAIFGGWLFSVILICVFFYAASERRD